MVIRNILVLLAFSMAGLLHAGAHAKTVDEFIAEEMNASKTPGLSYAVVRDEKMEAHEFGVTRKGANDRVAPDTAFIIGSVSKSFTALAIMQLVEERKIALDAPVAQYLKEFEGQASAEITMRQMLSHTSGFSTVQGNLWHGDFTKDDAALQRRIAEIALLEPAYRAGERWEYSNANYMVLGRIIEAASGQNYAQYLQQNIFAPLAMDESFVVAAEPDRVLATAHLPWFFNKKPLLENRMGMAGAAAGGIASTPRDLAKYMAMMMNGEDDLLSAAGKAQMMQPANDQSPYYGFGWFLDPDEGSVSHSGSVPGFESLLTMIPTKKTGLVALVNAGSGTGFGGTYQLRRGVTTRELGLEPENNTGGFWGKLLHITMIAAPFLFAGAMIWAWVKRDAIRAKTGIFGKFSIWFPLLTTAIMAGILIVIMPMMFGATLSAVKTFQPDAWILLVATAILGPAWAIWRIGLHYWPRPTG